MQWRAFGRTGCGVLAGLALIWMPHISRAAEPERIKFYTYDKVEIHGTFYPSDRGAKAPCALLLHAIGGNSEQEGWVDLAKKLQKDKGFAVLAFDFRGHGDSKSVEPEFWADAVNKTLRSYKPSKLKEQIDFKDFSSAYHFAMLVNDITAAKHYLDRRCDGGDCNSSNVIVIGAESGATLGTMWISDEWQRRRPTVFTGAPMTQIPKQGEDIACAIWLSISPTLGMTGGKGFTVPVDNWLRSPVREKVPMYFLYGESDSRAASFAKHLVEVLLRADRNKLKWTGQRPLKGTKLSGHDLLGKSELNAEDLILTYISRVLEDRVPVSRGKGETERASLYPVRIDYYLQRR